MYDMGWLWILAAILGAIFGVIFFMIGFLFYTESPNILIRLRSPKETREFGLLLLIYAVMIWMGVVIACIFSYFTLEIIILLFSAFFWLLGFFVLIHPGAISERDESGFKQNWGRGSGILLILVALFLFSLAVVVAISGMWD